MKKLMDYSCDGGTIAIVNNNCVSKYFNGYGDGCFSVFLNEKEKFCVPRGYTCVGTLFSDGNSEISKYDCRYVPSRVFLKKGKWGIYSNNTGNIVIDYWGDEVFFK